MVSIYGLSSYESDSESEAESDVEDEGEASVGESVSFRS